MNSPTYRPLDLGKIEEGRFLQRVETALAALQAHMLGYLLEHQGAAEGAKGKLTVEISIVCENVKEHHFSIKTEVKPSVPALPPGASLAIGSVAESTGEETLFVRQTGSDQTTPRQGKFCRDDGTVPAEAEAEKPSA